MQKACKKQAKIMHFLLPERQTDVQFQHGPRLWMVRNNGRKIIVFFKHESWKNITKNVQKSFKNDVTEYLCCRNLTKNYVFSLKKEQITIKNTKNATELSTRNPQSVTVTCVLTNFEHDDKKKQKNNKKTFKNHSKTMSPNIFTSKNCREMMFFRKK